jgi:hypothetical protein
MYGGYIYEPAAAALLLRTPGRRPDHHKAGASFSFLV